ncbi:MAG: hypothetical protein LBV15_06345 [Planctomycetota bacterium]|jgi:DNA-binding response OmpR family regulator|nr:hypothetical protein [Planctomycetota bacterium]
MSDSQAKDKPYIWLIDSDRRHLAEYAAIFSDWADALYLCPGDGELDWNDSPDAVFFSAELDGGAGGERFASLCREAGDIPLLAVARWRSLAQALDFFRAGAVDYLSLPLSAEEARERLASVLERNSRQLLRRVVLELAPAETEGDSDAPGVISVNVDSGTNSAAPEEDDILAGIDASLEVAIIDSGREEERGGKADSGDKPKVDEAETDEPEIVDGLPISTLWEELPCGIIVFDSSGNLAFSNSLGLELFGHESPAALQEALTSRLGSFAAYAASRKPLAANQWPHLLARKAHAARAAVISIERPDRRRLWLRIDCLPHLAAGEISRLSMTVVNLTGELPAFLPPAEIKPGANREKTRRRTKHKR